MAFCAFCDLVPFGEWEKIVFHFVRSPTRLLQVMAFLTFSRKACLFVVWIGGGIVIL